MRVFGLAGWSGAGKTTLVSKLIPELARRGWTVSTVKHAHHDFDIDQPGKDSYVHRAAGAREVLVASNRRWALMHELGGDTEYSLDRLIGKLAPCDLVLVEGFKRDPVPKLEVHRVGNAKPFLFPDDANIVALASDAPPPFGDIPRLHIDDIAGIADIVMSRAARVG